MMMKSTCQTLGFLSADDPAAELAAQIRARIDRAQAERNDQANQSAELFCNEEELVYALGQFRGDPAKDTLTQALAAELMMTAQKCAASLLLSQSDPSVRERIHPKVAIFETTVFLWSAVSFEVRKAIRHEFEQDRSAIAAAVLASFSAATSMMKPKWDAFYPERYSLSRVFFYPADPGLAAKLFLCVMVGSQGLDLPMTQDKIRNICTESKEDFADSAVAGWAKWVDEAIRPGLCQSVAEMVVHYLAGQPE